MSWTTVLSNHVVHIAGWRRMFRAVLFSAALLCAQSGEWARVQALPVESQVEVKRVSGGGEVKGAIESASDDALVVRSKDGSVTIDRADVRRLRWQSDEKTKSGRIAGTAILGGLGLMGAAISDTKEGGSGMGRALVFPVYAGIGYLIGRAADGPKRVTIYKAPK